jgi:hypothetical protein
MSENTTESDGDRPSGEVAQVRSKVDHEDWMDMSESEFVDYVEGRRSFGLVFEHEEIGLHGIKFDPATGVLKPVAFSKEVSDE